MAPTSWRWRAGRPNIRSARHVTAALSILLLAVQPWPTTSHASAAADTSSAPARAAFAEYQAPVICGDAVQTLTGTVEPSQAKTYQLEPFEVPEGTARIEVSYTWDPVEAGVLDLGVWDSTGTAGVEAFRSWAGSRQGRIDKSMPPLVIAPDRNERTVVPQAILPGTWHIELGIAALDQQLTWRVEVRCPALTTTTPPTPLAPDPVDPTHVARPEPGWYAGDFHLHGFHSSPNGPTPDEMITYARTSELDIVPVTEYVTPAHWERLGAAQRDNPDLLIWPGREVITYFGHMIVLGETPSGIEYRVGYEGIGLDEIQRSAAADGALVSLAHPTLFPPDVFGSTCRGCYFELLDQVDFDSTHLIEIVTEGSMATLGDKEIPNPFVRTAIELWERLLREGHRLTAVSGSDDKEGPDYGKTSTMVYASELSRPAVDEALRRGHAYVRGMGKESPTLEMEAVSTDGTTAIVGDTLVTNTASGKITIHNGLGSTLALRRNGSEVSRVEVTADPFVHTFEMDRDAAEGPLGTFWGAEVLDPALSPGAEVPTVIANPIFLASSPAPEPKLPVFSAPTANQTGENATTDTQRSGEDRTSRGKRAGAEGTSDGGPMGGNGLLVAGVVLAVAALVGGLLVSAKRRRSSESVS